MLRWQFVRKIARENDGLRSVTPDGKAFLHIHVWVCARCTRLGRSMGFNLSCDGEDYRPSSYSVLHSLIQNIISSLPSVWSCRLCPVVAVGYFCWWCCFCCFCCCAILVMMLGMLVCGDGNDTTAVVVLGNWYKLGYIIGWFNSYYQNQNLFRFLRVGILLLLMKLTKQKPATFWKLRLNPATINLSGIFAATRFSRYIYIFLEYIYSTHS